MSTLERTCEDCGTRATCPLHAAGVQSCGLYVTVAEEVNILRSALDTREAECDELKAQILAERTPCDMDLVATLRAQLAAAEAEVERLRAGIERAGKIISRFCDEECPVNSVGISPVFAEKNEFGPHEPNPEECKRGCPCIGRDIWIELRSAIAVRKG